MNDPIKYYVMVGDEQRGPFTLEQVQEMWKSGTVTMDTQYWVEGLDEWMPLSSILDLIQPPQRMQQRTHFSAPPVVQQPVRLPTHSPSQGLEQQPATAHKVKKGEFVGVGAAVQAGGCLALLAGGVLCTTVWGILFGFVGVIIGLLLLIIGGRMAIKLICSNCGNKLSGKEVKICPVCNCHFNR